MALPYNDTSGGCGGYVFTSQEANSRGDDAAASRDLVTYYNWRSPSWYKGEALAFVSDVNNMKYVKGAIEFLGSRFPTGNDDLREALRLLRSYQLAKQYEVCRPLTQADCEKIKGIPLAIDQQIVSVRQADQSWTGDDIVGALAGVRGYYAGKIAQLGCDKYLTQVEQLDQIKIIQAVTDTPIAAEKQGNTGKYIVYGIVALMVVGSTIIIIKKMRS